MAWRLQGGRVRSEIRRDQEATMMIPTMAPAIAHTAVPQGIPLSMELTWVTDGADPLALAVAASVMVGLVIGFCVERVMRERVQGHRAEAGPAGRAAGNVAAAYRGAFPGAAARPLARVRGFAPVTIGVALGLDAAWPPAAQGAALREIATDSHAGPAVVVLLVAAGLLLVLGGVTWHLMRRHRIRIPLAVPGRDRSPGRGGRAWRSLKGGRPYRPRAAGAGARVARALSEITPRDAALPRRGLSSTSRDATRSCADGVFLPGHAMRLGSAPAPSGAARAALRAPAPVAGSRCGVRSPRERSDA
jgi:hypothetical protein